MEPVEQKIKEFIKNLPNLMRSDSNLNASIRNLIIMVVNDAIKHGEIPAKK